MNMQKEFNTLKEALISQIAQQENIKYSGISGPIMTVIRSDGNYEITLKGDSIEIFKKKKNGYLIGLLFAFDIENGWRTNETVSQLLSRNEVIELLMV
jgi:hypothetical protein